MATTLRIRRGSAVAIAASSYILKSGEPGYDETSGVLKIGNGVDLWDDLPTPSEAEVAALSASVTTALTGKVSTSRTVNGHPLSADVTVTKANVGLGSVDNTSDSAKVASGPIADALDVKAEKFNLQPAPLADVVVRALGGAEPMPIAVFDGKIWGARNTTIAWSDDECATWNTVTTAAPSGTVIDMQPTNDGEMLVVCANGLHKSVGWAGGSPTFVQKFTPNGVSQLLKWSLSGDGTKFITTEYAAGAGFADSRYGRISLDAGTTWNTVYDSVARYGSPSADQSHLHGSAYDPLQDAFYISEGHGPDYGIYVSTDDGATWTRTNLATTGDPSHTVLTPYPTGGMVMASDNATAGVFGAEQIATPVSNTSRRVWAWRPGVAGVVGFGVSGEYDAYSGLVFFGFKTGSALLPPMIVAGSPGSGGHVWSWPDAFVNLSDAAAYPLGNGRLVGLVGIGDTVKTYYVMTASIPKPVAAHPSVLDAGNALGGTATSGDSVAIGPRSTASTSIRTTVAGVTAAAAAAGQDQTALGYAAVTSASNSTAVGSSSSAAGSAAALGNGAVALGSCVAVGSAAVTSSTGAVAIGQSVSSAGTSVSVGTLSSAASASVAVGYDADSTSFGVAVGRLAKVNVADAIAIGESAVAGHSKSIVLGRSGATTAADQVHLGARHIEITELAADPAAPATNGARLFVRDNGSGKTQVCVRFATGVVQVISTEP
jgi:hypothetical protein